MFYRARNHLFVGEVEISAGHVFFFVEGIEEHRHFQKGRLEDAGAVVGDKKVCDQQQVVDVVLAGKVQHPVLPSGRNVQGLMDERVVFDNTGSIFRHFFHKGVDIKSILRIVGIFVAVAPEGRGKEDDFLFPEERILFVEFLSFFHFPLPVKKDVCARHAESFDFAGRDSKGFRVNVADGLTADADKVIVSMVHGTLRRAAGFAHAGETEGLEGAAGMPELHHFGFPADVQPVELRVKVFQDNHPGFGTFSGAFAEFFLLEDVHGVGIDELCHFNIRVVFESFADQLQVSALFRQTLR